METMKKQWGKALVGVQEFVPQEYIAACAADEYYRVYKFWCDFEAGNYVWLETNGTPGLQSSGNWTTTSSVYDHTWASQRPNWGSFSPCGGYHEVKIPCDASGNLAEPVENYFPKGYVSYYKSSNRPYQECYIWTDNGTNTHVTKQLSFDDYHISNPS